MSRQPYDKPSQVEPVEGDVSVRGPGAVAVALTPDAARQTAARLQAAAGRADQGHVEQIDPEDADALQRWAERLGADTDAVRNAVIAVGPDSEAVAMRLKSARGAAD